MKHILIILAITALTAIAPEQTRFAVMQNGRVTAIWDTAADPSPPNLQGGKTLIAAPSYVTNGWQLTPAGWITPDGRPPELAKIEPMSDLELLDKTIARLTELRAELAAEPRSRRIMMDIQRVVAELRRVGKRMK